MTHDLKSWPEFFKASLEGIKKFELRKNDRDFKVGDQLVLWEYIPETDTRTGRIIVNEIVYVLTEGPWLQPGYCALGLKSEFEFRQEQSERER